MFLRILSTLAFVIAVLGIGMLAMNRGLFSPSPVVIVLQVAAVLLMLWARVTLGRRSFHVAADPTEGGLVTGGPYRFVRHPIYTAVILFTVAGAAPHLTVINLLLALLVVAGMVTRMLCEESFLQAHFPEYAAYAARTARIIPWLF